MVNITTGVGRLGGSEGGTRDPFLARGSPTWGYLLWLVVVRGACVVSFQRREL